MQQDVFAAECDSEQALKQPTALVPTKTSPKKVGQGM